MILNFFFLAFWLGLFCASIYGTIEITRILDQISRSKDGE